ncbi:protein YqbG [Oceanobacillus sp. CF4.6]|uniref:protein YqbG n=1 Tax=Oceanobacillus sp. CF4.6 TaxID=3373080 RepID=UPI003EE5D5DF
MTITPLELKAYTDFPTVKDREDSKIQSDILEAETHIEKKLGRPISDFDPLPEKMKLALLKVAQFFALINSDESMVKGFKSEKIGDYSYTLKDGTSLAMPDVQDLISDYVAEDTSTDGGFFMRMRSI